MFFAALIENVNSTKIWLTQNGGCILANNNAGIPQNDINYLLEIISAQYFIIVAKWKQHFKVINVKYYC